MTIEEICKEYNIEDYTINPDGSIDVYDNVDLYYQPIDLDKIEKYYRLV